MDNPEVMLELTMNLLKVLNIAALAGMAVWLFFAVNKYRELQKTVDRLNHSLEEMDGQAKLIVRTDMELNKTQEELDKKISGLYAMQRLSRSLSTTLEEGQIFRRITTEQLEELGFEKACVFLWHEKEGKFVAHLSIGYLDDEGHIIRSFIDSEQDKYLELIKKEKAVSYTSLQQDTQIDKNKLSHVFKANSFVISPILPKEGKKGFLFVGTDNLDVAVTAGDEELITILTNQIGQGIVNARLFESTWATILPKPPCSRCSSAVTIALVWAAASIIAWRSTGFNVDIFKTRHEMPADFSDAAACTAMYDIIPVAIMVASFPSARTSALPSLKLQPLG